VNHIIRMMNYIRRYWPFVTLCMPAIAVGVGGLLVGMTELTVWRKHMILECALRAKSPICMILNSFKYNATELSII